MKKEEKWQFIKRTAIVALTVIIVFSMVACDDKANDGGKVVTVVEVQIPGGSFEMGSGSNESEKPVHTVTLSSFYMGKYEVTQEQWEAVMGSNPSFFAFNKVQSLPVERVNWYDALVFCNKLSMREGLSPAYRISGSTDPAKWGSVPTTNDNSTWDAVEIVAGSTGYRLPTEAQWEYAARGGNGSPGNYTYSGSDTINYVAWYEGNCVSTRKVGEKAPNGLGLYDMTGNVWEWCWNGYGKYPREAQTDPEGWVVYGSYRVLRGGSWDYPAERARSTYRYSSVPYDRSPYIGFRLVRP